MRITILILAMLILSHHVVAQSTAFTYQGQLKDNGNPANGRYDLIFQVFDSPSGGSSLGGSVVTNGLPVTNGLFTINLDFGSAAFTGPPRWLQIQVSTNGAGLYAALSPRQPLTPTPYATFAATAGTVPNGTITSSQLANNAVSTTQLAPNAIDSTKIAAGQVVKSLNTLRDEVTLVPGANVVMNTIGNSVQISALAGDLTLTNVAKLNLADTASTATGVPVVSFGFIVNATVSSGGSGYSVPPAVTVSDSTGSGAIITATISGGSVVGLTVQTPGSGYSAGATLSMAPPPSNASQTFTGVNVMSNPGNSFSGSFNGDGSGLNNVNGAVPWQVVSGQTALATNNVGYLLTNNALVQFKLPTNPNVGDIVRISGSGSNGWRTIQNSGQFVLARNNSLWTPRENNRTWTCVASSADGMKLFAGDHGPGLLYASLDAGATWTPHESSRRWQSVACSADGSKVVAVDQGIGNGKIYTSIDFGTNWTARATNANWLSVASSSDGTKLAAVVYGGQIYVSPDSGVTWTPHGVTTNWVSIASSSDGTKLVAAVQGGLIYNSIDSGVTWNPLPLIFATNWVSVVSSANGDKLVAVVYGGLIYTSTNSGALWFQRESLRNWLSTASSSDGAKLVAVVDGGQIFTSSDSGSSWFPRDSSRDWFSVASSADGNRLVAVVQGGQIYTYAASTLPGAAGSLTGEPNSAVELQYIGGGQFIQLSHEGSIIAY
jgi:hypothetical protein